MPLQTTVRFLLAIIPLALASPAARLKSLRRHVTELAHRRRPLWRPPLILIEIAHLCATVSGRQPDAPEQRPRRAWPRVGH